MHFAAAISIAAMSFVGMATAKAPSVSPTAIIVVENLRTDVNATLAVPLGQIFNDESALGAVSTLYLTASTAVPVDTVTCTPYLHANGTGDRGNSFTIGEPSRLDLNTVKVGSIVCEAEL
jgi:hypothetical protein